MASCEKCWKESNGDIDLYHELLKTNQCTPEEQAGGKEAGFCKICARKTIHAHRRM